MKTRHFFVYAICLIVSAPVVAQFNGLPERWYLNEVWEQIPYTKKSSQLVASFLVGLLGLFVFRRFEGRRILSSPSNVKAALDAFARAKRLVLDARLTYYARFRPCNDEDRMRTLIEDIPRAGSADEERRFLQLDNRLVEAKLLFESAARAMENVLTAEANLTPADRTSLQFNVGNAFSQIGFIHRARFEYDEAEAALRMSISYLESIVGSGAPPIHYLRELAIAWERLGDAQGGRFRTSGSMQDKTLSAESLQRAIRLYEQAGDDTRHTRTILSKL